MRGIEKKRERNADRWFYRSFRGRPLPALLLAALLLCGALLATALADNGEKMFLPIVASPPEPGTTGKIVYTINSGTEREIYTMPPDGSGRKRLTENEAVDDMPAWSLDGQLIAFTSDRREAGYYEIYTMLPDGSDVERLTSSQWDDNSPSFSPNGEQIVFASNRSGRFQIFVMNSDGSDQQALTSDAFISGSPDWSSDGQKIVYSSDETGGLDIYMMDPDGSNKTPLTTDPAFDFNPAWSPNGQQIVFTSLRDGDRRIYVMDADGSNQQRLTDFYSDWADWSPDGAKIIFTRRDESAPALNKNGVAAMPPFASDDVGAFFGHRSSAAQENSDLYTMNADGSDQKPLTETAEDREDRGNWGS
ncbi:MAG: hypothetical protein ACK2UK_10565 [Candidatus Promineifilaceae bacterium]